MLNESITGWFSSGSGLSFTVSFSILPSKLMVAKTITILMAFSMLAVGIGYALAAKAQLQGVTDAAARFIGYAHEGLTYEEQQTYTFSSADILAVAKTVALQNMAAGENVSTTLSRINGYDRRCRP